jgi:VanZ family protein
LQVVGRSGQSGSFALPTKGLSLPRGFGNCFLSAVSKARSFIKYWLLPLLWMVVIFSASGDQKSFQHSSRIIAPLLHWLLPHLSEQAVNHVVVFVRKCAHLTEYAILAFLFWHALRKPVKRDPRPWAWREAKLSIWLVALYAATDEFHQLFVPSREASVRDVLIDTTGAICGMVLLWTLGRRLKWWRPENKRSKEDVLKPD